MQDQEERIAGAVSLGKSLESSTQVEGSSVDRSTGSSMGTGKQVDGGGWESGNSLLIISVFSETEEVRSSIERSRKVTEP